MDSEPFKPDIVHRDRQTSDLALDGMDGGSRLRPMPRRRVVLPLTLFALTCLSTFWVGASLEPLQYLETSLQSDSLLPVRKVIVERYRDGLIYMAALLGILFAHEMGHFLMTVAYRVPASFPYFLPLPITPIGTLGAVISVDGRLANRKQIFDIGLAGPIAGLIVAVPLMFYAAAHLELAINNGKGGYALGMPIGIWLILQCVAPENIDHYDAFWLGHLQGNPLFLAGWVGFLITGLNMIPISQLDGGHVIYCLLGRRSYWVARGILLAVGFHVVWSLAARREPSPWLVMALLVLVIGPYHPPTRDDSIPIGLWRAVLGILSLTIPILCLPLHPLRPVEWSRSQPALQTTLRGVPWTIGSMGDRQAHVLSHPGRWLGEGTDYVDTASGISGPGCGWLGQETFVTSSQRSTAAHFQRRDAVARAACKSFRYAVAGSIVASRAASGTCPARCAPLIC